MAIYYLQGNLSPHYEIYHINHLINYRNFNLGGLQLLKICFKVSKFDDYLMNTTITYSRGKEIYGTLYLQKIASCVHLLFILLKYQVGIARKITIVHLASPPPATAFQSSKVIMETPIIVSYLIQTARLVLPVLLVLQLVLARSELINIVNYNRVSTVHLTRSPWVPFPRDQKTKMCW